jgi:hypothetical protein
MNSARIITPQAMKETVRDTSAFREPEATD